MKTKTTILLIICVNILIYCSCGSGETREGKTKPADSTGKEARVNNAKSKDPRNIGGDKSDAQLTIEKAMADIDASSDPILGYWVGAFGKNRINLALSAVGGGEIWGHSVCAGNYRPIKGTIILNKANPHTVVMEEPGDDQYDGKFEFAIDLDKMEIHGKWKPYKEVNGTTGKEYTLKKRTFKYDPSVGEYPQASQRLLTEEDVQDYSAEELEIMRNEIYARHGYSFKNKKMRQYFESKDWYMPIGIDIREQLTEDEAKNIELIYQYEDYYKTTYDQYGR